MISMNTDNLYECKFQAWALGPVAIPLYKEYKKFEDGNIVLDEFKKLKGKNISDEKKEKLQIIYDFFGKNYTAIQLVNFTHMVDSPWYETWEKNGGKVKYGTESNIDKIKTKEWFRRVFINAN
jgi:uncharacterized phage-associated protein